MQDGYHPQVEAISPTGPSDARVENEDTSTRRENLLSRIHDVDISIAKEESKYAKLRVKKKELEEKAAKPLTMGLEVDDASEADKATKNQSIAQVIYAENRVSDNLHSLSFGHAIFCPKGDFSLFSD